MISRAKSDALFAEALQYIPGGVNSPVRAFRAVGGKPFFVNRAGGCRVWDVDGNEYIDYVGTWGPAILGHAHPKIIAAVKAAADHGTSFGIPNPFEVTMAKLICSLVPSVQKVRMTNSGTEACMSAIRLARGFTKRDKIIKFDGCYHGHGDSLLVRAGSGVATFGLPDSPGVPQGLAELTTVLPYNDEGSLKSEFDRRGKEIAGVIVEPIAGNMGCVAPRPGYLELLRDVTKRSGTVLIFDEVMTGFRVALGGAQQIYGVTPDLTTLGKVIGGGLPVGAYGGRAEIMDRIAPAGPVYQAGTLSGNPLAVSAGLATLRRLQKEDPYGRMEQRGAALQRALVEAAAASGIPVRVNRIGSMLTLFFTNCEVTDFDSAKTSDLNRFNAFFHAMLDQGIYLPPSQFEVAFISAAHTESDIDHTIKAATRAFSILNQ
jgi:glutamate-1-semialdehyde 2,1-aminomutase